MPSSNSTRKSLARLLSWIWRIGTLPAGDIYPTITDSNRAHCLLEFVNHMNAIEIPDSESYHDLDGELDESGHEEIPEERADPLAGYPVDPSRLRKSAGDSKVENLTKAHYENRIRKLASCYQRPVGHL